MQCIYILSKGLGVILDMQFFFAEIVNLVNKVPVLNTYIYLDFLLQLYVSYIQVLDFFLWVINKPWNTTNFSCDGLVVLCAVLSSGCSPPINTTVSTLTCLLPYWLCIATMIISDCSCVQVFLYFKLKLEVIVQIYVFFVFVQKLSLRLHSCKLHRWKLNHIYMFHSITAITTSTLANSL